MIHSTTWIDLKDIMLCEKTQSQKVTYCTIPFIWHSRSDTVIEMKHRLVIARSWRQWESKRGWDHKRISQGELYGGWSVLRLDYSGCHTDLPMIKWHRTINKHCADVNFLVLTLHFACLRCDFLDNFIYLFIAVLGLLCCCKGFYLVAESGSYSLVVVLRLLIVVASLVTDHRL